MSIFPPPPAAVPSPRDHPPRLRLPPHRLALDEGKFLRLLSRTFCLTKADKRHLLLTFPRLTQHAADSLLETWTAAEARLAREEHPAWTILRCRVAAEWRELERELSR